MAIKKADKVRKKPLKILLYGDSGVGKTHFALQATPGATLIFDAESGTDMFEGMPGFDFDYWVDDDGLKTASIRELRKAIDYLATDDGRKQYKTFIIDPISDIWDNIQSQRLEYKDQRLIEKAKKDHKEIDLEERNETELEAFNQKDWGDMKRVYKNMMLKLKNLPQNVILIAREKEISETKPDGSIIRTGEYTYEAEKNTKYAVDFNVRLTFNDKTKERKAIIVKTRNINMQKGTELKNPTFAIFDSVVNSMANGEDVSGISEKKENVFNEEEEIKQIQSDIILFMQQNGGKTNETLMNILKKYEKSGNPNKIKDFDQITKLYQELQDAIQPEEK
jgi:hypothetical protein